MSCRGSMQLQSEDTCCALDTSFVVPCSGSGLGFRVSCWGRISEPSFRVWGLGFRISGSRSRSSGFGMRDNAVFGLEGQLFSAHPLFVRGHKRLMRMRVEFSAYRIETCLSLRGSWALAASLILSIRSCFAVSRLGLVCRSRGLAQGIAARVLGVRIRV